MRWQQSKEVEEKAVGNVLRLLTQQPPPAGMEARILTALRGREAVRSRPRPWRPALAAAVVLCGVAAGVLFAVTRQRPALPQSAAIHAPRAVTPRPEATHERAARAVAAITSRQDRIRAAASVHRQHAAAPVLAYRAASFPAPPRPLTEQERLLQIVVQQHNPAAIELLNQAAQEREMARNRAAFEAYFYQPTEEEIEKHAQQIQ